MQFETAYIETNGIKLHGQLKFIEFIELVAFIELKSKKVKG